MIRFHKKYKDIMSIETNNIFSFLYTYKVHKLSYNLCFVL